MTGFLLLHRKLADSQIWGLQEPFCYRAAWIDLLLHTAYAPVKLLNIDVCAGEFASTINELLGRYGWEERKLFNFLDFLRNRGMIRFSILIGANGRIVKLQIVRWQEYQFGSREDEKKRSKRKEEENKNQDEKQDINGLDFYRTTTCTDLDKQITDSPVIEKQDIKTNDKKQDEKQDIKNNTEKEVTDMPVRAELDVSEFTPSMKAAYQKWKENMKN